MRTITESFRIVLKLWYAKLRIALVENNKETIKHYKYCLVEGSVVSHY